MQILDGHTIAVETAAEGRIDIIDISTDRLETLNALEVEHRIGLGNLEVRILRPGYVIVHIAAQFHHIQSTIHQIWVILTVCQRLVE